MKIKDFLDTQFKSFSTYDCMIKLPSLVDGFKISQRKVIHTMINNDKRWKVEAFAPFAQSYTAYHHGAGSLEGVAVNMAQDFIGTNNINYLIPDGSFGTREVPVASAGRYIYFDGLNKKFHDIFLSDDNKILEYHIEDGESIEPVNYLPILPNLLINGAEGIATGFASMVLKYNPIDIKQCVQDLINGKKIKSLIPWYKGFKGSIKKTDGQTVWKGLYKIINTTTIQIDELPIGYDKDSYKRVLDSLCEKGIIKDYDNNTRKGVVSIELKVPREFTQKSDEQIVQLLRLERRETENITGWSYEKMKLVNFSTIEEYLEWWVQYRILKIDDRKLFKINSISDYINWLEVKMKFIKFYIENPKQISKLKQQELIDLLIKNDFKQEFHNKLLDIKIYNLTSEQIEKLQKEIDEKKQELVELNSKTSKEIYLDDLKMLKL